MPTDDSTTPRFSSDGPIVRFATAERFLPYAVTYAFPWATESKAGGFWDSPERAAERIADALNAAEENRDRPWTGYGPTPAEAGGESILARYVQDLQRAQWSRLAGAWIDDTGLPVAKWEPAATGWRPMPKA